MNRTFWSYCGRCKHLTKHEIGKQVHITKYFTGNEIKCLICKNNRYRKMSRRFKTRVKQNFDKEGHDWPM